MEAALVTTLGQLQGVLRVAGLSAVPQPFQIM